MRTPETELPGQDSNLDKENQKTFRVSPKPLAGNTSGQGGASLAPLLAPEPEKDLPADPDLARLAAAWPELPEHIKAAVLALVDTARAPALAEADVDRAFDRLDRQAGAHNFVSLVDLRRALPAPREAFDGLLRQLRLAGRYTLSAADGRHGISAAEREAGIVEEGALLLFVSRR